MGIGYLILLIKFFDRQFTFFVKFICQLKLFGELCAFFVIFDPLLFGTQVFNYYFGFFCVVPEVGRKSFFFFI
jgi:hypothetical protein